MKAALKSDFVSVEDYLAGEEASDLKHEYIGGVVYAMAGVTKRHNLIAQNICQAFRQHLKGGPCSVFISDVKVQLSLQQQDVFYYPDLVVGCDPRDTEPLSLQFPKLLVEVSSESTERIDRHEKLSAYQAIETLQEYVIVAQDRAEATVFRRATNWSPEVVTGLTNTLKLIAIDLTLPLSAIYEGVLAAS
jgi:Uma2 family endonuclease